MGPAPKCHFVMGLPSWDSRKIGTPATLEGHNFVCKPPIEVRFKAKLEPSSKAFQWYVACHLHVNKLG